MNFETYRIFPLGTDAVTIEFGNEISVALNDKAVSLAKYFWETPFAGLREIVPAYAAVTIFYDVDLVRKHSPEFPSAFEAVKNLAENAIGKLTERKKPPARLIEIPVDFSPEYALDLEFVAIEHELTEKAVIDIFTGRTYRVFMLGFMPAFAYMGEISERIATARKQTPRLHVPQGSVGIAGRQTGIYPFDSPGGWQIIGRTNFQLFTPQKENPCALRAGDLIKFYASDR